MKNHCTDIECLILQNAYYTAHEICRMVAEYPGYSVAASIETCGQLIDFIGTSGNPDLLIADSALADGQLLDAMRLCQASFPLILTSAFDRCPDSFHGFNVVGAIPLPVVEKDLYRCLGLFLDRRAEMRKDTPKNGFH